MTSFLKQTIKNRTILKKYNFTEENKNKFECLLDKSKEEITTLVNFCNDQLLIDQFHTDYNLENKCQTVYTKMGVSKSYSRKKKNKNSYRRTTQSNIKTQKNVKKMQEYILNFIACGNYNSVYNIENRKNRVFRELSSNITTNIEEDEHTKTELNGLFIQWYLSNILCKYNICKVFEFGYQQKENEKVNIYAILEKVEEMNKYIDDIQTNFDTELAIILVDILEGLDCIHSNKYVHMDIKLDNIGYIIQNSKINTKLLDFSTLMKIDGEDGYNQNISNSMDVTLEYADPLFTSSNIICSLYDIFSFGIMIFFIIYKKYEKNVNEKWINIINKCIYPVDFKDIKYKPNMSGFKLNGFYTKKFQMKYETETETENSIIMHDINENRFSAKQLINYIQTEFPSKLTNSILLEKSGVSTSQ
jgi:serine/threonine protein kinase